MNINNAFPSKWIKSGDLETGDLILTVSGVKFEVIERDSEEKKPVLYFHEIQKGLVLNKTNADARQDLTCQAADPLSPRTETPMVIPMAISTANNASQ